MEYVRVRDELGHRFTVHEQEALNHPDVYEVIDEPAVNPNGDPLPAQHNRPAPPEPTMPSPSGGFLSSLFRNPYGQTATDNKES